MKTFGYIVLAIIGITVLSVIGFVCNNASRFVSNGVETAHQQFDPSALLVKYEWFKDASAQLDKKLADINTYKSMLQSTKNDYGENISKWPRDAREDYNQHKSEMMGIINSYNQLASDYNSSMVKFNYKFCNIGDLPRGADVPLPREYKQYINEF